MMNVKKGAEEEKKERERGGFYTHSLSGFGEISLRTEPLLRWMLPGLLALNRC